MIQPAPATQRPEDELVEEAAVPLVERFGAGRRQGVGHGDAPGAQAAEDLEGNRPRGGRHAQPSRAPGRRRAPAAQADAGMARRLSGWTSTSRRPVPSPQATTTPSERDGHDRARRRRGRGGLAHAKRLQQAALVQR